MVTDIDLGKSIEELEGESFGDPSLAPTNMVKRCLLLTRTPIGDLLIDDLRLLIGQGFSL